MKVLLDECIDWRLSRDIFGHEVKTARQMGWTAIKNGEDNGFEEGLVLRIKRTVDEDAPAVAILRHRTPASGDYGGRRRPS